MRLRFSIFVVLTLALLLSGTVAYGYWSSASTNAGSGMATTGTTVPLVLTPAAPAAGLQPGGSSSVTLTVSNPNTIPIRIGTLALDTTQGTGGFAVSSNGLTCSTTSFSFTSQTNGGAGWTVPAAVGTSAGSLSLTLPNAVSMAVNAANGCQNATVTVYLEAQ